MFARNDCSMQVCSFPGNNKSEVAGSTLPGMDATATLGESVIFQTYG
jgi:hypothetical protein